MKPGNRQIITGMVLIPQGKALKMRGDRQPSFKEGFFSLFKSDN
jgi:hypothetical protein